MKFRGWARDLALTALILTACFGVVVAMQRAFDTAAVAPAVFVMAVFLVSLAAHGYGWVSSHGGFTNAGRFPISNSASPFRKTSSPAWSCSSSPR